MTPYSSSSSLQKVVTRMALLDMVWVSIDTVLFSMPLFLTKNEETTPLLRIVIFTSLILILGLAQLVLSYDLYLGAKKRNFSKVAHYWTWVPWTLWVFPLLGVGLLWTTQPRQFLSHPLILLGSGSIYLYRFAFLYFVIDFQLDLELEEEEEEETSVPSVVVVIMKKKTSKKPRRGKKKKKLPSIPEEVV